MKDQETQTILKKIMKDNAQMIDDLEAEISRI